MPDSGADQEARITISDQAAKRIGHLRLSEGNDGLMLRITVSGGGCAGFQYAFNLDSAIGDEDVTFEHNGIQVVTDTVSLGFLAGSVLDFKNELGGSYFAVSNPNATSSCGCGTSFSV
ncbi:MAG: iron-sulfur cluster insertion protein ErpA [Proteobacteria bacterium]|nr:iron-sulfur cluster insertion protein ErpA [Pseudomonadota bacterium]